MIKNLLGESRIYRAWIALLLVFIIVGLVFYILQLVYGLKITNMGRDVSWGLYIANLTFFVGVAASAVMVVLPYYLHNFKEFGRITIIGEFLAVAAVGISMLSVIVDLGHPGRTMNLILYPSPNSVLFWDVVVLGGYLLLNFVIASTNLYSEHKSKGPPAWVKPLIYLSIPWAIGIHTATAFIYSGLAAKPFWMTGLLAPRFLASAFASGPALLIIISLVLRRFTKFDPGKVAIQKLVTIATYGLIITMFFLAVELFTVFYSRMPEHMAHFQYLLFGLDGHGILVPWMWSSIVLAVIAIVLLVNPNTRQRTSTLAIACVAIFISMWIDKGLGLIVPGFIPSPSGDVVEYFPSAPEILIALGVGALGFLALTIFYKITIAVKEKAES